MKLEIKELPSIQRTKQKIGEKWAISSNKSNLLPKTTNGDGES